MDKNKAARLREVDYRIPVTCGTCVHGTFSNMMTRWGTCALITYDHLKHVDHRRHLSIYRYGTCPQGVFNEEDIIVWLGAWQEFIAPREGGG